MESELDPFLDAQEEFFYDCFPSSSTLRRRKSTNPSHHKPPSSSSSNGFKVVGESLYYVLKSDELDQDFDPIEQNNVSGHDPVQDPVDPVQDPNFLISEESTVTNDDSENEIVSGQYPVHDPVQDPDSTDSSLLGYVAGLVIKAIEFQVNLMISLLKCPSLLLNWWFMFTFDPFSMVKLVRGYVMGLVMEKMEPLFKDSKQMLNVACKFGWGLFWAVYVGFVLFGLLVMALMVGGFVISRVADKPFVVKEVLNFDFTKNSPEAFVAVSSCAGVYCEGSCKESEGMWKGRGTRVIPKDHKLDVVMSMTVPESVYNKNLGMFQVRVDFLSADGETIASIRRPCMLRFRSEPIRLVQTFFKVVPLVTGYVSEIQTLSLNLKGFVEREIPTACLKIMIEQRAEFRPGAGIPELYDASLSLESDLPFFKKIIWKWRKTLFVWISMSLFVTELLFALVCCRPLIIPRTRRSDIAPSNPTRSRR